MLFSLLRSGDIKNAIITLLLLIPILLITLTVHEVSHGYAAYKLGDPTARNLGRLSLNPLKHLDPIGSAMLLLFGFGWAKPVPINSRYFHHMRRDIALVSLAGPMSNFLLAFIGTPFYLIMLRLTYGNYTGGEINSLTYTASLFFELFVAINIGLAVFNLIPIPPLDGSRLITVFLPPKAMMFFFKYERYIQIALFVLLWWGVFDTPLNTARSYITMLFIRIWNLIPFFQIF